MSISNRITNLNEMLDILNDFSIVDDSNRIHHNLLAIYSPLAA